MDIAQGRPVEVMGVEKMSKSKKNVVAPEDIFDQYGVDAARLFVLSDSPPERDVQWSNAGVEGAWRLIHRLWAEFDAAEATPADEATPAAPGRAAELRRATHKLIKAVGDGLDGFRFNTAVAAFYSYLPVLKGFSEPELAAERALALSVLARLVAPLAPHMAEEAWARLGMQGMVVDAPWPVYDPAQAADDVRILPIQINGKRRTEIEVSADATAAQIEAQALGDEAVLRHLDGLSVRKVIVVKDRIVNIVAG